MKFIIKLFPEITIKSKSIRLHFIKILTKNIKHILNNLDKSITIIRHWDCIEVYSNNVMQHTILVNTLMHIPGIHHILEVQDYFWNTLEDIYKYIFIKYHNYLVDKSFCVRVKRRGNSSFTSQEVERYVGKQLNKNIQNTKVKLTNPDKIIFVEIVNNKLILIIERFNGLGGFPIGTQGKVLSLISGGFDSGVASYMLLRRGCRVNYCFFNLGGLKHETVVRQTAYHIWKNYGTSHKVYFFLVDFMSVMNEIILKVKDNYRGIILKRMMIRAASIISKRNNINAIVTGEVLGQVSSQTLVNLHLIDDISDILILRPLISYDKEHIIKLSRQIGIEALIYNLPEYCGLISKKAITSAKRDDLVQEETKINLSILDAAILKLKKLDINITNINNFIQIKSTNIIEKDDIVLDIRSLEEQELTPLFIEGVLIEKLPFYKIQDCFCNLDPKKSYLLYCNQGIMSNLQALYLYEQGFYNIKIYQK